MTFKGFKRLQRATALRTFLVSGLLNSVKITLQTDAYTADLAMRNLQQLNPSFIPISARCKKILVKETK